MLLLYLGLLRVSALLLPLDSLLVSMLLLRNSFAL
jgi:hypothetical protein